jgi:Ca-activated chloride channel homolog
VRSVSPFRIFEAGWRLFTAIGLIFLSLGSPVSAQVPIMNAGPDGFAQIDFEQMYLDQINRHAKESLKQKAQDQELIDSGAVSALDLGAPNNAVEQFNRASTLLKAQKSQEAIKYLQKAISDYPKFVAAHMALGRAFVDLDENDRAKSEFEAAEKIDSKFAGAFLNLGRLALSANDFATAESELEKAENLRPKDPKILSTLAFAENGNHEYVRALATVQRLHSLDHKGMANAHYLAASAAMSLKNYDAMERELNIFISEDPTSEYAALARQNLAALARNKTLLAANTAATQAPNLVSQTTVTFPNSDRLKAQLSGLNSDGECGECSVAAEADASTDGLNVSAAAKASVDSVIPRGVWLIHKSVDDVAVFFSVTNHGHMINDLDQSDIHIRDNNKTPSKVVQFSPQSKLPLRLALLIDTSGSVRDRFSFEKNAAAKFVEKVLNNTSDLAFIAGFSNEIEVTQDFSPDPGELGNGIQKLTNGGGTSLFDAVSFACRKLAAYPENQHVARVLVVLTDGEDNSSHATLKQTLAAAERAGVSIYAISTREERSDKTDADRILEALADQSGGEAMFPGDILTLGRSFDKLRDLIRSRYFIAYKPADFTPDGSYHAITILAEKNGKRLQVRSRKGYHARLETVSK